MRHYCKLCLLSSLLLCSSLSLEALLLCFCFASFCQGIARPLWEVSQRLGMPPVLGTVRIWFIQYHLVHSEAFRSFYSSDG
jgi:hypothetical protein